jgi:hypothetical protein
MHLAEITYEREGPPVGERQRVQVWPDICVRLDGRRIVETAKCNKARENGLQLEQVGSLCGRQRQPPSTPGRWIGWSPALNLAQQALLSHLESDAHGRTGL